MSILIRVRVLTTRTASLILHVSFTAPYPFTPMSKQNQVKDQRPMTRAKESVSAQTTSSTSSRNAHPTDLTSMQPQGYSTRSTGQPPQQATLEEVLKERRDVSRIQHPDQGAQFTISTTHSFPILSTGVPGTVTAPTIQSLMTPERFHATLVAHQAGSLLGQSSGSVPATLPATAANNILALNLLQNA